MYEMYVTIISFCYSSSLQEFSVGEMYIIVNDLISFSVITVFSPNLYLSLVPLSVIKVVKVMCQSAF